VEDIGVEPQESINSKVVCGVLVAPFTLLEEDGIHLIFI
jgi:hypothetical protein